MKQKSTSWDGAGAIASILALGLAVAAAPLSRLSAQEKAGGASAADAEKQKALANPFPNDLGPDALDAATLKAYPADIQEGYKLLRGGEKKKNCQSCHTSARPLNSRFFEPEGKDLEERKAKVAKLKKEHPEYFADPSVLQIEPDIWQRYVKRMASKPGCSVSTDAKAIWKFLVYDGNHRKIGENFEKWKAHRKKLVEEFKQKYPKRYQELSESKPIDL